MLITACVLYYTGVSRYPLLGLIPIITPIIFLANILLSLYWLLMRRKLFILPLFTVLLSLLVFSPFYKFETVDKRVSQADLRIMSFNARGFNRYNQIDTPGLDQKIVEMVKSNDPDVVCFQEFDYTMTKKFEQYPYRYVNYFSLRENKVIQAILSKYPFSDKGSVTFPKSTNHIIYADIQLADENIRVYNAHLQSFRILPSMEVYLPETDEKFLDRLGNTFRKQEEQARIFREHMESNELRTVICADLNNTPYSNVYRRVKGSMKDSYAERGKGFGTSFRFMGYPLRIDYILASSSMEITAHQRLELEYSDHYPLLASIRIQAD